MKPFSNQHIFGSIPSTELVGRTREIERLMRLAHGSDGLALHAAPNSGSSELLKQVYDKLFAEQEEVIPFYFSVKKSDGSALQASRRFLRDFLVQTVAFRRRNAFILDSSPDIYEIAELAVPADGLWIDRLIETAGEYGNDDESLRLASFLSSPLRAKACGVNVFVIVDDLHEAVNLQGGDVLIETLCRLFGRWELPSVICGHRRFMYGKLPFETMHLERLSFSDSGKIAESLALKYGVSINDQTRDLISVQLQGNPVLMNSLFAGAAENNVAFASFLQLETVYADEVLGGRISRHFDAIFNSVIPDAGLQNQLIGILTDLFTGEKKKTTLDFWQDHLQVSNDRLRQILALLNDLEIVSLGSSSIEAAADNIALNDYLLARQRLSANDTSRAQVVGSEMTRFVKRAPQLMAKFYRRLSAIGLREVMRTFDGREVACSLFDYGRFRSDVKGSNAEEMNASFASAEDKITLPQIVYTAHTVAYYRQIGKMIDTERSAIALGFEKGDEKEEVVWIATEIDSKLEATADLAEFWCDRLEMVAASCDFSTYKIWLVAPEGFSEEALALLSDRGAIGSSRQQVDLLVRHLGAASLAASACEADEYEIVIPMGVDTEMIAAHTIEEIAKRREFPSKTINQIKTALIEACINATEHSLSPDRKIYQKFAVTDEKVTITISNRGLRLADKAAKTVTSQEGRRGWGLKLIKSLMDEVIVEQTDDGTRIIMTKSVKR